ncbi:MAG: hypothetical protein MHMPM18_000570 [Marteilia pararefringens]
MNRSARRRHRSFPSRIVAMWQKGTKRMLSCCTGDDPVYLSSIEQMRDPLIRNDGNFLTFSDNFKKYDDEELQNRSIREYKPLLGYNDKHLVNRNCRLSSTNNDEQILKRQPNSYQYTKRIQEEDALRMINDLESELSKNDALKTNYSNNSHLFKSISPPPLPIKRNEILDSMKRQNNNSIDRTTKKLMEQKTVSESTDKNYQQTIDKFIDPPFAINSTLVELDSQ